MNYLERIRFGKYHLDAFSLKMIAVITMLIDHVGCIFFPQYIFLRMIGRIAFPIFAYFIAEGFYHTRNVKKYLLRLFIFALITELPFDYAFFGHIYFGHQNVLFTFIFAILAMCVEKKYGRTKGIFAAIIFAILAELIHCDYGMYGVIIAVLFYWNYDMYVNKILLGTFALLLCGINIQMFAALAMVPIAYYNGKLGFKMKYFFYIFYPAHLIILFLIHYFLIR